LIGCLFRRRWWSWKISWYRMVYVWL